MLEGEESRMSPGTSLVVQWIRILLLKQETWVRLLVWEDPTCQGEIKPMQPNTQAHML